MEKTRISYEVHHNEEDYFLPFLLETKIDGKVVSSESFQTLEEIFQKVKEQDERTEKETEIEKEEEKEI